MNESSSAKPGWRRGRRLLIALAILATLIAIFYTEEDWRGQRAWLNCKRELEAKGVVLDWDKYIPAPVPDDQNFFTASSNILLRFKKAQSDAETKAAAQCQWLRIDYSTNIFPSLDLATNRLVVAELIILRPGATGLVRGTNHVAVTLGDPTAREQVRALLKSTIGEGVHGVLGFDFCQLQLSNIQPAQVFITAPTSPSLGELSAYVPPDVATNFGRLRVTATRDPRAFQIILTGGRVTWAGDFLKWSDQYMPALEEVRAALDRPYAVIPGDYTRPYEIPIVNFVTMRSVAQLLGQRAQCHLLLGQPDQAVRELQLIHDVTRILQKPPAGKSVTLVDAMIHVAIMGLYAGIIPEGFQLHAWQESQLKALENQLAAIGLPADVSEAFDCEQAATARSIEMAPAIKLKNLLSPKSNWLQNLKWALFPHGWIYQNMVTSTQLTREQTESLGLTNGVFHPQKVFNMNRELRTIPPPYKFIAAITVPDFTKAWEVTAYNQTFVNEAQIACALERYRLARGEYPDTLDALVPQFIGQLPHDIIGGQPLHYRRIPDGNFLLYSVGWNEKDDGGKSFISNRNGSLDYTRGDWVWTN